jgi:L-lactate utilization protein LutC
VEPLNRNDELLRRIGAALRGKTEAAPFPPSAERERTRANESERISRFRELFEEQGGRFLFGSSPELLLPILGEALRRAEVVSLVFPPDDREARFLAEALVPFGPFLLADIGDLRRESPPAAAGLQTAECAIAETGTIVQTSRDGKTLLPGLLPDIHIALLPPSSFVDRLEDGLDLFSHDPPRNISFISGPSRSADIEQTLTVGAHGPKAVIAVLLP